MKKSHVDEATKEVTISESIPATKTSKDSEEHPIPSPVYLLEKSGGMIVLIPNGIHGYQKLYFDSAHDAESYDQKNKDVKPRKIRQVTLPVTRDGNTFRYIDDLFVHLCKVCGYKVK